MTGGKVEAVPCVTHLTFNACLRRHQKDCRTKKGEDGRSAGPFPKAKVPEDGIPKRSANRLRPGWLWCGTSKQPQINATIPARRLTVLTRAARGAIALNCRRKYPANGSINNPVSANPPAASR